MTQEKQPHEDEAPKKKKSSGIPVVERRKPKYITHVGTIRGSIAAFLHAEGADGITVERNGSYSDFKVSGRKAKTSRGLDNRITNNRKAKGRHQARQKANHANGGTPAKNVLRMAELAQSIREINDKYGRLPAKKSKKKTMPRVKLQPATPLGAKATVMQICQEVGVPCFYSGKEPKTMYVDAQGLLFETVVITSRQRLGLKDNRYKMPFILVSNLEPAI